MVLGFCLPFLQFKLYVCISIVHADLLADVAHVAITVYACTYVHVHLICTVYTDLQTFLLSISLGVGERDDKAERGEKIE